MKAMVLSAPHAPLVLTELPDPVPAEDQVLLRVTACGVCRTDLHVVDGELPHPKLPLVPGHEIVGVVAGKGARVDRFAVGDRVGVPWLGWTCGVCEWCRSGRENLCDRARFTGYDIDGGFAELTVADARFCFPLPAAYSDVQAAPLLCAGSESAGRDVDHCVSAARGEPGARRPEARAHRGGRGAGDPPGVTGSDGTAHMVRQIDVGPSEEIAPFPINTVRGSRSADRGAHEGRRSGFEKTHRLRKKFDPEIGLVRLDQ
jgi:hypothetical protein